MNAVNCALARNPGTDLKRIIEPLANYICATDQPRRALISALAVLFNEVESTNRAAVRHCRAHAEN